MKQLIRSTFFGTFVFLFAFTTLPVAAQTTRDPASDRTGQAIGTGGGDCDNNAVVRCGVSSTAEVRQKYMNNKSVRVIFNQFDIRIHEMNLIQQQARNGHITSDGKVVLNGQTVATDARTAGRQNMSGSRKVTHDGITFYTRPVSVSFNRDRLDAFIVMTNGNFQYAIIKSCGNPVIARPVAQPKPQPTTQPQPQQPTPAQPIEDVPVTPAAPAVNVTNTNTNTNNNYNTVNTEKTADDETATRAPEQTYVAPSPAPVETAPTTVYPAADTKELPATGPVDAVMASLGLGAAGGFGHMLYVFMRRKLGIY